MLSLIIKLLLRVELELHKDSHQRTLTKGGNINCTADLLLDWFGFGQTSKAVANSTKQSSRDQRK